jgi:hypothetical protein
VTGDQCRRWRGELARRALGHDDPAADPALDAHLDGCRDCQAELDELRAVADVAALADAGRLGAAPVAPPLADRIVARVAKESATSARRRRRLLLAAASAAAAVIAVLLGLVRTSSDEPDRATPIDLAGVGGVDATATLTERAWGTEVTLEVSGLDQGEMYWLWLSDADGRRVIAGSLTGTGGEASAVLASALPTDDARRIWMTDEDDRVVLDADVRDR